MTWDRRPYFPSEERREEDFFGQKIRRLRPGFKYNEKVVFYDRYIFHDLVLHKTYCALRGIAGTAPKLQAYTAVMLVISYGHDTNSHENLSTKELEKADIQICIA